MISKKALSFVAILFAVMGSFLFFPNNAVHAASVSFSTTTTIQTTDDSYYTLSSINDTVSSKLDSSHFITVFAAKTSADGTGAYHYYATIGTAASGAAPSFLAPHDFYTKNTTAATATTLRLAVSVLSFNSATNTGQFVVAFPSYDTTARGLAIIGTISNKLVSGYNIPYISSYGSAAQFSSGTTVATAYIALTALDSGHFIVAWYQATSGYYSTSTIGTVSGTAITYGTYTSIYNATATQSYIALTYLDSTHFVAAINLGSSGGIAFIGAATINSGNAALSYVTYNPSSAPYSQFNASTSSYLSLDTLDYTSASGNGHFVAGWQGSYGAVCTIDSNSISTCNGTAFASPNSTPTSVSALDSGDIVEAVASSSGYFLGTINTGALSFSSYSGFYSGASTSLSAVALDSTHFVVVNTASSVGYGVTGTLSSLPALVSPIAIPTSVTTATLGATVNNNGGYAITDAGVCWGTSPSPRSNCIDAGVQNGTFTVTATGLPVNTTIYYAGYATNSAGTGYSNDGTFNTGFTVLRKFTGGATDGFNPVGTPLLYNGVLYGMTSGGGASNWGTIYSFNVTTGAYSILHNFSDSSTDGASEYGSLIIYNGVLYGMSYYGAPGQMPGSGAAFSIHTDGTNFTFLHGFPSSGSDGSYPRASFTLYNGVLYGTTTMGGSTGYGTVFSMNPDGTNYQIIHNFLGGANGDGSSPQCSLTLYNGVFYGTTNWGGSSTGYGTVFSMNPDGTNYQIMHIFLGGTNDGKYPQASLTLYNGVLYGMTNSGGSAGDGTIFSINPDGTNYQIIRNFLGGTNDGSSPSVGNNLEPANGLLYGMTYNGGSAGVGTIFSINPDGTNYQVLRSLSGTNSDGRQPMSSLTLSSNGLLYGTGGGSISPNWGTIFEQAVLVPSLTLPTSVPSTATLGATVNNNGGYAITDAGVCWGTSPSPRSNCVDAGVQNGTFTVTATGLPVNTTIYYAGYATNSAGTGYSNDGTFTSVPLRSTPPARISNSWVPASGSTIVSSTPNITFQLDENGYCRASTQEPTTSTAYTEMSGLTGYVSCIGNDITSITCPVNLGSSAGTKDVYIACLDDTGNQDTGDVGGVPGTITHLTYNLSVSSTNTLSIFGSLKFLGNLLLK